MPSFDIVSKLDFNEVDNAVNQTMKEVTQRFDFKGTNTKSRRRGGHDRVDRRLQGEATMDVLQTKLVKRGVSLSLKAGRSSRPRGEGPSGDDLPTASTGPRSGDHPGDQGFEAQGAGLVPGRRGPDQREEKDDLQEVISLVRKAEVKELPLQFTNFRD